MKFLFSALILLLDCIRNREPGKAALWQNDDKQTAGQVQMNEAVQIAESLRDFTATGK